LKIHFHGAARTVTGSQHLIEINEKRLLLECGLFQGRRRESYERNQNFPFEPASIDAVILSHAHIDHSGNLPNLVKQGYRGPIYATSATRHLADVMLRDSGHIHESDAVFVNKRRARRGEPPIEPLYTIEDAAEACRYLEAVPYDRTFEPVPGVSARLMDAGHILGSAAVVLDVEEGGQTKRLWFSGDIGRPDLPLLRAPVFPSGADWLIMESTYGDRHHLGLDEAFDELLDVVVRTVARDGKVIVPSFAVGRTQELVYCLHRMIDNGDIPRIPVFVDSPLAVNVTDIFRAHPECFDETTQAFIQSDDQHHAALGFDLLTYVRSVEESKSLNYRKEPMVIISASGMAENGRILHHLRNNIEDPRNTILIVSWQAPHTLGRRLVEGQKKVKIFGETFRRKAEVVSINGFSAHADQPLLVDYASAVAEQVERVFLVHGESRGAKPLMKKLKGYGIRDVSYPDLHESVTLGEN
jgi:metallo-beta-lactamase family protein